MKRENREVNRKVQTPVHPVHSQDVKKNRSKSSSNSILLSNREENYQRMEVPTILLDLKARASDLDSDMVSKRKVI